MRISSHTLTWTGFLAANCALLLVFGYWGFRAQGLSELAAAADNRLTLFVSSLDGKLERFEYLPALLANAPQLEAVLRKPYSWNVQNANRFLESSALTARASDIYLMNAAGLTVAASNWNLPRSFMGRNFSFRPYFKQAMAGGTGRYFALGTTSNQRGFYYSHPVTYDREIRGVVVVKLDLADIEDAWSERGSEFIVTDEDGIVFLSTRDEWRYLSIRPLDSADRDRIRLSRRYADAPIERLHIEHLREIDDATGQVLLHLEGDARIGSFVTRSRPMPAAGWTVHILSDTRVIQDAVILKTALAGFAILVAALLVVLYAVNRQRQRALVFARDRLEARVEQRTRELSREVDERRRTEDDLRRTQAELIHAAKMAGLGQMAAGISHELNQPLTAIRSFADNARRMLERQRYDLLHGNLEQISELTGKMAGIIAQLRGFSRKSRGEHSTLSVAEAVHQAFGLFERDIDRQQIETRIDIDPDAVLSTDPLLLNQVLVNLVSNAVHAVSGADHRVITAGWTRGAEGGTISISDSGPGIDSDVIDNIFDPFFTTKEVGLGLGLGLSISYRIVELLGGSIHAANAPGGGARFAVTLPLSAAQAVAGQAA